MTDDVFDAMEVCSLTGNVIAGTMLSVGFEIAFTSTLRLTFNISTAFSLERISLVIVIASIGLRELVNACKSNPSLKILFRNIANKYRKITNRLPYIEDNWCVGILIREG